MIVFFGGILCSNLVGDWASEVLVGGSPSSEVAKNVLKLARDVLERYPVLIWFSGLKTTDLGGANLLIAIEGLVVRVFLTYALLSYAVFAKGVMEGMCEVFDILVLRLKKKKLVKTSAPSTPSTQKASPTRKPARSKSRSPSKPPSSPPAAKDANSVSPTRQRSQSPSKQPATPSKPEKVARSSSPKKSGVTKRITRSSKDYKEEEDPNI
ncbi:hypothetical protein HDV05_002688, partial [Chytridiales sp. JEL 0842]